MISELLSTLIMGLIIGGVIIWLAHKHFSKIDYHVPCEYKIFKFSYRRVNEVKKELEQLSKEGWEIASFAGEDSFATYFLLQRAIEDDED